MKRIKMFLALALSVALLLSAVSINAVTYTYEKHSYRPSNFYPINTTASVYATPDYNVESFVYGLATYEFSKLDEVDHPVQLGMRLRAYCGGSLVSQYWDGNEFGNMYNSGSIDFSGQYPDGICFYPSSVDELVGDFWADCYDDFWEPPTIIMDIADYQ